VFRKLPLNPRHNLLSRSLLVLKKFI